MTAATHARLAILGAGPHALAVAIHAVDAGIDPTDLVVFDPAGGWLTRWHRQFRAQGISHLRSPGVHHPGTRPGELTAWCQARGQASTRRYGQPRTSGFAAYCDHLVESHGLSDRVRPRRAALLGASGPPVVLLDDQSLVHAERVVVATNPFRPRVPAWAMTLHRTAPGVARHATTVDLDREMVTGRSMVIIGGGQSAAHLAVGAASRGAHVHLICRRPVRTSPFDVHPGWLGPRYLDGFDRLSFTRRAHAAAQARDGGSISPDMAERLHRAIADGTITLHVETEVVATDAASLPQVLLTLSTGERVAADGVWLATGTDPAVEQSPLFEDLRRQYPCPIHAGLPALDDDLSWPGSTVHCCGRAATLQLGPAAGNLWGARMAARRIIPGCLN